ncbi:MAG TPA: dTDP-4-dehydrorhamnose 3,5-epimerase [Candidatus Competibacteraceae bacterium]|nr:dTDP-4-dehydrorhamnose 3,5-epimerase [Candidatus Competibacteraceae bacterium]MCP5132419.1 dTDP-4-dehydrorhamnose 3,5-epimerase [Gammaproteobacteria bacterium]HPF57773.1 dTDP-4-dehydrorhamnose 3,5-epimerase [Candidatus Competibacteraceae bacterium]HRY17074.1 dTDP-4-dehydrorhamnose 3,5-epimerase [Candidatus Competibacteraceae bacterium]
MKVIATELPGVLLLEPETFGDARGFFMETWQSARYHEAGMPERFVQDNHSRSRQGVLRGLHYQLTQPQGKLVWVTRGTVFDVAVDIRRGSPHFGRWYGCLLDDADHRQLYIPPGFAHGFCVVSEEADFFYKCTDYYHPQSERGIAWNDPEIGIQWPLSDVSLSGKDQQNRPLNEQAPENLPVYEN